MVVSLRSEISEIVYFLRGLKFEEKKPESLTNATLITLGYKINYISIRGVLTNDDIKWIRKYCNDINHFWIKMPSWLRKAVGKLSSSAGFTANLNERAMKSRIIGIVMAYKELTNLFIGVYQRAAA